MDNNVIHTIDTLLELSTGTVCDISNNPLQTLQPKIAALTTEFYYNTPINCSIVLVHANLKLLQFSKHSWQNKYNALTVILHSSLTLTDNTIVTTNIQVETPTSCNYSLTTFARSLWGTNNTTSQCIQRQHTCRTIDSLWSAKESFTSSTQLNKSLVQRIVKPKITRQVYFSTAVIVATKGDIRTRSLHFSPVCWCFIGAYNEQQTSCTHLNLQCPLNLQ